MRAIEVFLYFTAELEGEKPGGRNKKPAQTMGLLHDEQRDEWLAVDKGRKHLPFQAERVCEEHSQLSVLVTLSNPSSKVCITMLIWSRGLISSRT